MSAQPSQPTVTRAPSPVSTSPTPTDNETTAQHIVQPRPPSPASITTPTDEKTPTSPAPSVKLDSAASTLHDAPAAKATFKPDARFYLVFLALCCSMMLSALDLTAVSTILPTIAADLQAEDPAWIGSSYALTSTALIPFVGGLCAVFGRRPVMVGAIAVFLVGSAIAGSAKTFAAMIAGRSIQGVGGGAIMVGTEIIVSDLVPIAVRGAYYGFLGLVWALSSAIAPPIAGALGSAGAWRWLFYMNVPIGGIALVLVALFLNVKVPKRSFKEQLGMLNHNNYLFIAAATSATLGLSWAGSEQHAWSSASVLAPLILGLAGIAVYLYLERFMKNPTIPWDVVSNRTSAIGYLTTLFHSVLVLALVYYLPIYYQAAKGSSPVQSGVDLFSVCFTIAPFAIVAGMSTTITGHYKIQNLLGWVFAAVGLGLMTLIKESTAKSTAAGYAALVGIGTGLLYAGTTFPVIAPLRPDQNAAAMTAHAFTRSFGQILGIAIGGTILTSQLSKKLPTDFVGGNGNFALAGVPEIRSLPEPLRQQVRVAFAESLRLIWLFGAIVAAVMFFCALAMRSLPLTNETDDTYGLQERKQKGGEKAAV